MNLNDLSSRVDSNTGNAQVNRAVAQANPEFDAGMGDGFDDSFGAIDSGGAFNTSSDAFGGFDDAFGSSNDAFGGSGDAFGGSGDAFGGSGGGFGAPDPFGGSSSFGGSDAFGGGGGGFGFNSGGFGQPAPQPATPQDTRNPEDKAFDAAKKAATGSMNFFKALTTEFRSSTPTMRATWGRYGMIMGAISAGIGILLAIFCSDHWVGLQLIVGSLVAVGISTIILAFAQSQVVAEANRGITQEPTPEPAPIADNTPPDMGAAADFDSADFDMDSDFNMDSDFDPADFDDFDTEDSQSSSESDSSAWDAAFADVDDNPMSSEPEPPQQSGIEAATDALEGIQGNGLYDRRSLFERQCSVLSNITPEYATQKDIAEGTDLFNTLDTLVQQSAEPLKTGNTNETPYLISATDTLFYIRLEISRPKFIKNVDAYTQEIVNIFQYDRSTGKRDKSIYGIGEFVGNTIFVKLMKGESAFVSLKDIYNTNSADILDYKNKMPVVLGVDIEGSPVICDFYKLDSILITGMPRSGKTWLMLSVLYQMMAYMSPEELNVYIFDPKGKMSDFASAITPHVKNFVSDDASILAQLKHVVRVEGPRRKAIIGEGGCVNLQDYRKKFPDCNIPFIYVIIDEVVTLSERMSDDDKREFQSLLSELVSQLPAAGIRIFMVPHLVKDNIIKKNTTSLIPCRISVMGNKEHIESSCGVKNFPHALSHVGDTCTVIKEFPEAMFIHSVALAKENEENKQLFHYLAELWARICPDSVAGSIYERIKQGKSVVDDSPVQLAFTTAQQGASAVAQGTTSAQSAPAPVNKRGTRKAKPIPANTTPVEVPFSGDSDDINSWGNDIRANGKALNLNDEVNLFDDDF